MRNHLHNVMGAIVGQAIGDSMGSQTEFSKGNVAKTLRPTWGYSYPAFSDDTQNMMAIGEALLTVRPHVPSSSYVRDSEVPQDVDELMTEIGRNFVKWNHGDPRWGANNRSPGGACMAGTHRLETMGAEQWRKTGNLTAKGNGGAMRSSVVGCYYWRAPIAAFQIGALTSVPTHMNLESLMASGMVAFLVASAIAGQPFAKAILDGIELCRNYESVLLHYSHCSDEETEFPIARFGQAFLAARAGISVKQFHNFNGNDFKGAEAVAAAIHANAKFNNYRDTILTLANETGDSDTTAAIGGAIAGARYGLSFIDGDWRGRIEKSDYLHDMALRIWKLSVLQDTQAPASPQS